MRAISLLTPCMLLTTALATAAPAAALPAGDTLVVGGLADAPRCYLHQGPGPAEWWIESNGRTTGGEATAAGAGSGLQRTTIGPAHADTRVASPLTWVERCAPDVNGPPSPALSCSPFPSCVRPCLANPGWPFPGPVVVPCEIARWYWWDFHTFRQCATWAAGTALPHAGHDPEQAPTRLLQSADFVVACSYYLL